jgi:CDP-diacylglycerol--glycerol-3-phosphate 3-phosphatidyltransferase
MTEHESIELRNDLKRLRRSARLPDLVILGRVTLAFVALGLFSLPFPHPVWGLALTAVAIAMDALDGWLARRLGVASELGAVLDITGDRIVEHVFWIYFTVVGLVPLWVPLVIVSRSFVVDATRSVALSRGRTPFGEKTMQRSAVSRFLVASRAMRSVYGFAKAAAFVLLGALVVLERAAAAGQPLVAPESAVWLGALTDTVVILTVVTCVGRGLPVLWDARGWLSPPSPAPRRRPRPLPAERG